MPPGTAPDPMVHEVPSQCSTSVTGFPFPELSNDPPTAQQLQALTQSVPSRIWFSEGSAGAGLTMFQPAAGAAAAGLVGTGQPQTEDGERGGQE